MLNADKSGLLGVWETRERCRNVESGQLTFCYMCKQNINNIHVRTLLTLVSRIQLCNLSSNQIFLHSFYMFVFFH